MNRWPTFVLSVVLTTAVARADTGNGTGTGAEELPQIGSPANEVITAEDEYRIGRMIVKGMRDAGQLYDDPEINEYLQTLGSRLASHAQDGGQRFTFFIVKDTRINAFALPGGFNGVNAG